MVTLSNSHTAFDKFWLLVWTWLLKTIRETFYIKETFYDLYIDDTEPVEQ
jgi:hypothetical protein